jgi:hypothetical protein
MECQLEPVERHSSAHVASSARATMVANSDFVETRMRHLRVERKMDHLFTLRKCFEGIGGKQLAGIDQWLGGSSIDFSFNGKMGDEPLRFQTEDRRDKGSLETIAKMNGEGGAFSAVSAAFEKRQRGCDGDDARIEGGRQCATERCGPATRDSL